MGRDHFFRQRFRLPGRNEGAGDRGYGRTVEPDENPRQDDGCYDSKGDAALSAPAVFYHVMPTLHKRPNPNRQHFHTDKQYE